MIPVGASEMKQFSQVVIYMLVSQDLKLYVMERDSRSPGCC